jgi:hypothetical protein
VNQLSIGGVYGLFLERIYHKIYIAKFTHISFGEPNLEQMSRSFLHNVFLREFRDGLMKCCDLWEFPAFDMRGLPVRSSR